MDAVPLSLFVVDEDVRIRSLNRTAAATLGIEREAFRSRRSGDLLHCLHAWMARRAVGVARTAGTA
ncbi:MAG: PAS domain-containing protein [Acidobacteriia bacterium]|nr:PAS domain-containing protein [Terriglobia bacterium]